MLSRILALLGAFFFSDLRADAAEVAVGSAVVKSIDVEDLLASKLNIDRTPRPAEDSACTAGGSGMRSKRYCRYVRQFRDLKVEKIIEISLAIVDVSKIPSFRKDEHLEFENRWKNDTYQFEQEATFESEQQVQVNLNETLTNVSDFTSTISIDAKIFDSVGIKRDDKIGQSVTFQVSKAANRSLTDKFTIKQPIKFSVPPCTLRWASYSDIKKDMNIPVKIKGLLNGRVVDFVQGYTEFPILDLKDVPADKRTFEISGYVELLGSNRSLSVKLGEKLLTDGDCGPK
jgi:hypothetical protein